MQRPPSGAGFSAASAPGATVSSALSHVLAVHQCAAAHGQQRRQWPQHHRVSAPADQHRAQAPRHGWAARRTRVPLTGNGCLLTLYEQDLAPTCSAAAGLLSHLPRKDEPRVLPFRAHSVGARWISSRRAKIGRLLPGPRPPLLRRARRVGPEANSGRRGHAKLCFSARRLHFLK